MRDEAATFRTYLQQTLLERCRKNPLYSMRAFAKAMNMSPSTLSHLLRGTRPLTAVTQDRISEALGLSPAQKQRYKADHDKRRRGYNMEALKVMTPLSADVFEAISDWIHDAILELTRIEGFKANNLWIARKLGVAPHEVNVAVERLFKLRLLEVDEKGLWHSRVENSSIFSENAGSSSGALKKHQAQILELSKKALDEVPLSHRDHTSSLMTISESDLKEVKARIGKFRREILAFAERKGAKAERLYQLSLGFFPIDKD